jgi:hypothetical protein
LYLQILRIVISRPENAIEIHINRIKTISVLQIEAVGSKKISKLSTNPYNCNFDLRECYKSPKKPNENCIGASYRSSWKQILFKTIYESLEL